MNHTCSVVPLSFQLMSLKNALMYYFFIQTTYATLERSSQIASVASKCKATLASCRGPSGKTILKKHTSGEGYLISDTILIQTSLCLYDNGFEHYKLCCPDIQTKLSIPPSLILH